MSYTAAAIVRGESKQVAYVALCAHFFDRQMSLAL